MSIRYKATGLAACLLLSVSTFQTLAQTGQVVERGVTSVRGGTISQTFTVSGHALKDFQITVQGAANPVEIKKGDRIEGLIVDAATVASATAHGGKLTVPPSPAVNAQKGTATATLLADTTLKDAELKITKPGASAPFKVRGTSMTAAVPQDIELNKAETTPVSINAPEVTVDALQKDASTSLGATTQAVTDWVGDYVIFNVDAGKFVAVGTSAPVVVAPKGTCFRVYQEIEKTDPNDSTKKIKYLRGTFVTGALPLRPSLLPPWNCENNVGALNVKLPYEVEKSWIADDVDRSRFGYTYGVLVAPFKFYARAERQFNAGASVGPYLGYRVHDRAGSSTVGAVAIGAASATVKTQDASGNETTSIKTGLTVALSLLSQFKNEFNVGLIVGRDFFSKTDNIPLSGRVWYSVSIGKKLD